MSMTVLTVDDSRTMREMLRLALADAGFRVVQAEDGEAGLAVAKEQSPELILCDVRMPKLGGIEFVEAYRATGGPALIMVMTASGSLDLAMEAMKKGAKASTIARSNSFCRTIGRGDWT